MKKTNAIILSIAIIAVTILLIVVCTEYEKSYRAMIKGGYTQKQQIGSAGYIWVKPKK